MPKVRNVPNANLYKKKTIEHNVVMVIVVL